MTIGDRIKNCREQKHLSQIAVADAINVSKQSLYKYENNIITNIPSDKIELLAEVLGTTPQYLMGWEDYSAPENHRPSSLNTLAAHFEGEEFTDEEAAEIKAFAEFVKSKRSK